MCVCLLGRFISCVSFARGRAWRGWWLWVEHVLVEETDYPTNGMNSEKVANENARYVLPNACETKIVFTMNVRSLYNFFSKRCCNRAQEEIRELADEMLKLVKEIAPILFKNAGAPCVKGRCPEGKMTCGRPKI